LDERIEEHEEGGEEREEQWGEKRDERRKTKKDTKKKEEGKGKARDGSLSNWNEVKWVRTTEIIHTECSNVRPHA
jgi:hypothetical protein